MMLTKLRENIFKLFFSLVTSCSLNVYKFSKSKEKNLQSAKIATLYIILISPSFPAIPPSRREGITLLSQTLLYSY